MSNEDETLSLPYLWYIKAFKILRISSSFFSLGFRSLLQVTLYSKIQAHSHRHMKMEERFTRNEKKIR